MNKYFNLIKNHIHASISIFAITALALSNTYFIVQAQEAESEQTPTEQSQEQPEQSEVQPSAATNEKNNPQPVDIAATLPGLANQPHPSCFMEATYLLPSSSTYNPVSQYNTSFVYTPGSTPSIFQDINGDNLVDYMYINNSMVQGSADLISMHTACVYLNNGSGWDRAYICFAKTNTDPQTGNLKEAEYKGDCAG